MKKLLFIVIAIAILIGIGVGVLLLTREQSTTEPPGSTDPFGNSMGGSSGGGFSTSNDPIVIQSLDGKTYAVEDFTSNAPSSTQSSGTYYYVTDNGSGESRFTDFDIIYGDDSSITVSLTKEPLGDARRNAEGELRRLISLSDSELCTLDVKVAVPVRVSEVYSGRNLGLSFCPGAIQLP